MYAAPEILQEVAHYDGEVSDAWSSGVILYALLCRRLPFQAHQGDIQALFRSIKTGDFTIPPHVSELPADLIRHMLQTEPSRRWTVAQSRAHAWFKRGGSATGPKPIKSSVSMDVPRGQASLASAFANRVSPVHCRAPCLAPTSDSWHDRGLFRYRFEPLRAAEQPVVPELGNGVARPDRSATMSPKQRAR